MFYKIIISAVLIIASLNVNVYAGKSKLAPVVLKKNQAYRLENQINGSYVHIGKGWWAPKEKWDRAVMTFVFPGSPGGLWKFKKAENDSVYIYNDSKIDGKPEIVYLTSPGTSGKPIIVASNADGERAEWIIKRVLLPPKRDVGFFTICNKNTGFFLTAEFDWDAPNLRENLKKNVIVAEKDSAHPRSQYWSIEPTVLKPIETLSVPQGGWGSWALNKIAVYSSNKKLKSVPAFTIKGPHGFSYKGKAFYWGQYWNNQYFYIINLNNPEINKEGPYVLRFNNKRVVFRITKNPYTRPWRQYGRDRFSISELFDPKWGFVGHWGHLSTWYPKGLKALGFKNRTWFDERDDNKNGKKQELIDPLTPITDEESENAFLGGWDMTDKSNHSFGCDGAVLKSLVGLYNETSSSDVKKSIIDEIKYGVLGLLANQESNGSWRQRTTDWTYWVGTTANIGAGLASVCEILKKYDIKLAVKTTLAVNKAWKFVYENRFNRKKWAITGEGVLPDGSVLKSNPQHHRQGYTEAYLSFAVEMSLLTGEDQYKKEVEDILNRAEFDKDNKIHSVKGDKFPGEQDFTKGSEGIIITLLKYYPEASAEVKEPIKELAKIYYKKNIVSGGILGGPYGKDGKALFNDYTGGQWRLPGEILIACQLYKLFGDEFAQGIMVSQRKMDWWFGCNPYGTSLILGTGDRFLLNGWSSYHALGRHVGMNSGPNSNKLEASHTNYIGKETTTGGVVMLWCAISMLEKISQKGVTHITACSRPAFKGRLVNLTYGDFDKEQLNALGMQNRDIESLKIPPGMKVTLYSKKGFKGSSFTATSDIKKLPSLTNKALSLQVRLNDK